MTCHFDGEQLKINKLYIAMYMRRSPIIQQTLIVIIDVARLGEGPWCLPGYCSLGPSKLIQIFINCLGGVPFKRCSILNREWRGFMQDKLMVFVIKLALLNKLLGANKITMREYIAVKSSLMRKYNVF